ncbi:hypothetical protein SAMN04488109_3165 [Chryseolinea serpens]|uniref:Uncharacterized protein n=1 Tax=Chryseolinea serpens TaxID=947013 RepID=A0A1M5R3N8_9BACT|nr:hypothetical protein SAMN04488109_3165 [Chryseolinea serpens]
MAPSGGQTQSGRKKYKYLMLFSATAPKTGFEVACRRLNLCKVSNYRQARAIRPAELSPNRVGYSLSAWYTSTSYFRAMSPMCEPHICRYNSTTSLDAGST